MKITTAKALNYKNRMASKLREVTSLIQRNNSVIDGSKRQVDVAETIQLRTDIQAALVQLKLDIYKSNMDIQEMIFKAAELRGEIGVWQGLNTQEGTVKNTPRFGGEGTVDNYNVVVSFEQVEIRKKAIQSELDRIQDKLDEHNHKTKVDVPDNIADFI